MQFTNYTAKNFIPSHPSTMNKSTRGRPYLQPQPQKGASYVNADALSFPHDSGLDGNIAARPLRRKNCYPHTLVAGPSNPRHFCSSVSASVTQRYDVNSEVYGNPMSRYATIAGDGNFQLNAPMADIGHSRLPSDPAGTYYTQTSPFFGQATEIYNTSETSFNSNDYGSSEIVYQSQNQPRNHSQSQNSGLDLEYPQQESGHLLRVGTPDNSFNNGASIEEWDGAEYFLQPQQQDSYVDWNVYPLQYSYDIESKPNIKNESISQLAEQYYPSTQNALPSSTHNNFTVYLTKQESFDFDGFQDLPPYYMESDIRSSYPPLAEPHIVPTHQEFEKPVSQEEEPSKLLIRIPAASSRGTTGTKKRSGEKKKGTIVNKKIERKITIHGPKPTQKDWLARAYGWKWLVSASKPTESRVRVLLKTNKAKGRMYENVHRVEVEEADLPLLSCPVERCTTQCRGTKSLQLHFKASADVEKDPGHALVINNVKEQPKITCIASDCDAKIARGGMFRHLSEFHSSVWIYCTICDHKNTREGNVKAHFRDIHTGEELPTQFREIVHHEFEDTQPAAEPCSDESSWRLLTSQACGSADVGQAS